MIEEKLRGSIWSLVTYQSEDKEGNIIYPLGADASGYIVFTDQNILSVQLMAADREHEAPKTFINEMNTAVEQEMAKLGYHAYSGPFSVDEDEGILTTHVELSLIADYIGSEQSRKASIEGDELHLSNVDHPERKLIWEKVKR